MTAAVELGEELVRNNWNGEVYAENRKYLYSDVLHELTIAETDKILQDSRVLIKEAVSRL